VCVLKGRRATLAAWHKRERAQGKGSVKRGKFETAVRGGLYRASVVVAPPFSSLMCRAHRPLG
jgi:hypothetical protein